MDWNDLMYAHNFNCGSLHSKHIKKKNVVKDRDGNEEFEVEYDAYCNECGAFLYHFEYGHYER
ncbi:MAG: hypothetical protein RR806_05080 [Oscillospiraceae bacterium]